MKKYAQTIETIRLLALKYNWSLLSTDVKTYRISFKDEYSIYRVDIYLSKMTIGLLTGEGSPNYYKNQSIEDIKNLFVNPMAFEHSIKVVNDGFEWDDNKVIDFVNWYIKLQNIDSRHELENLTIIETFKELDLAASQDKK